MSATEGLIASQAAKVVSSDSHDVVRLIAGISPVDLKMVASEDGQYLLIYCGHELVAAYGAMGGNPDAVEFAEGGRYSVEQLLDLVSGA